MKRVGFLGCGKIGRSMVQEVLDEGKHQISFVQDPFLEGEQPFTVVKERDEALIRQTDLVVEAAMADVLKANIDHILPHCDMLIFSVTAFADDAFYQHVLELAKQYQHTIYLPHGAILGVDGIADGRKALEEITIETIKHPKSLGRNDTERKIVYQGSTRQACFEYPRNVNVHATVALAGLGFDKTQSLVISDPDVDTNSHIIKIKGEGISFEIKVSSLANGMVTGKYTPYSAISCLHKVLDENPPVRFI